MKALSLWLRETGISRVSAWRFRQKGWLETVNIAGRHYITDAAIARFETRAAAGEFAQAHAAPVRQQQAD